MNFGRAKAAGVQSQRLKVRLLRQDELGGVPPWLRSQLKASSCTHGADPGRVMEFNPYVDSSTLLEIAMQLLL
jgi:hypothetical protein